MAITKWPLASGIGLLKATVKTQDGKAIEIITLPPEALIAGKVYQALYVAYENDNIPNFVAKFRQEPDDIIGWARQTFGDDYVSDLAKAILNPENMETYYRIPNNKDYKGSNLEWFINEALKSYNVYQEILNLAGDNQNVVQSLTALTFLARETASWDTFKFLFNNPLTNTDDYYEKLRFAIDELNNYEVDRKEMPRMLETWINVGVALEELPGTFTSYYFFIPGKFEPVINTILVKAKEQNISPQETLKLFEKLQDTRALFDYLPKSLVDASKNQVFFDKLNDALKQAFQRGYSFRSKEETEDLYKFIISYFKGKP